MLFDRVYLREVQVDFEARMPEDSDFHGIKTLLQQLFLKANIDLSDLTDLILAQNYIGSVIKQTYIEEDEDEDDMDDDDPVLGLTTVLDLTDKKEKVCVKQIGSFLVDQCQKCGADQAEKFKSVLANEKENCGLLINERFINIPPQISVPMFESLLKEIEKSKKKRQKFNFAYYILICKTYQAKQKSSKEIPQVFYTNAEEELLQEVSASTFRFSVEQDRDSVATGPWDADDQFEASRTVMLIPADKLVDGVEKIKVELAKT
ncbi:hypothetical protein FSP39_010976 [Pinctada imbricata]|uniref:Protein BCCIP homolog n=1 Tax=Pinctada imbricata TaxID=66713 RepID=A0AA88Y036_PINIB|nr:hypothetical protein FSP39_010976 [Pinctada imbricata]